MRPNQSKGAIIVELALTFPIFLLLIYFLLFFAYAMNARAQLSSATFNGPLLAITRGNQLLYQDDLISGFDKNLGVDEAKFVSIFKHGDPVNWPTAIKNEWAIYPEDYVGLQMELTDPNVPRVYAYALAYTYQQAKLGMGPGIRFPCIPDREPESAGCLNCRVMLSQLEIDRFNDPGPANIYDPIPIAISCVFQFPAFFSRPIGALLGLFGGGFGEVTTSVSTYSLGSTGGTNGITADDVGAGSIPIGSGPTGGDGGDNGSVADSGTGAGFADGGAMGGGA